VLAFLLYRILCGLNNLLQEVRINRASEMLDPMG
jgi:hypothetical protein